MRSRLPCRRVGRAGAAAVPCGARGLQCGASAVLYGSAVQSGARASAACAVLRASAVLRSAVGGTPTVAAVTCAQRPWAVPPAVLCSAVQPLRCRAGRAVRCSAPSAVLSSVRRGAQLGAASVTGAACRVSRPVPLVVPCAVCGAVLSAPAHRRVRSAVCCACRLCGAAPAMRCGWQCSAQLCGVWCSDSALAQPQMAPDLHVSGKPVGTSDLRCPLL